MILVQAFQKFRRNITLVIYPIIFDLISLATGLLIAGFYAEKGVSIRLILEMGLPSVSHISNIPLFANNMDFMNTTSEIPTSTVLIVVTLIVIAAFLQGGYIGHLHSIVTNQKYSFTQFMEVGKRSWIQFVILEVIIFLGKISVAAFLASFFGIIGVFASLLFFFVLRIIFIYLEFTMVVDRKGITPAIKISRQYFTNSVLSTLPLIILLFGVSSLISFALHYFWSPWAVVGTIFIYAILMSLVQLTFMMKLVKTKKGNRIVA